MIIDLIIESYSQNNDNKKNNKSRKPLGSKDSIGLTLTYEEELSTKLYEMLAEYIKQQNKLNEFLQYVKRDIETYFLDEITDIFHEAIRKLCNMHDISKEGAEIFLRNNWGKLRFDELIRLIITDVYDHSPLAVERKTRHKQLRQVRQEFSKDIIDNWFAIIDYNIYNKYNSASELY